MADKNEAEKKDAAEAAPNKKKTPLLIGGGVIASLALGYIVSLMAVPKKEAHKPHLEGPFVAKLSKSDIQVNLAGESSKRYLVMSLNAEYSAYSEAYVTGRLGGSDGHGGEVKEDPVYIAMLKDALLKLAATKTRDEVTNPALIDGFLEEIELVVDPILFPVHVGDSHAPSTPDSKSGLRVGESNMESTMRGFLHEHEIKVSGKKKTIALDDGAPVEFEGTELDLKVSSKSGQCVYLDTTGFVEEFSGTVAIGVPGKVRRIYRDSFLVQ
ncbi:MAG: hypothetical protein ACKVWV_18940 [Planctomycetota bacterium]